MLGWPGCGGGMRMYAKVSQRSPTAAAKPERQTARRATVLLRQLSVACRKPRDPSVTTGRQHRKARISAQIQKDDARRTRRWRPSRVSAGCSTSAAHACRSNA